MDATTPTTRFLKGAMNGDEASLEGLARKLRPLLGAMARARLPDVLRATYDTEDLIQDVWLIVLQKLGDIRPRNGRRTPVLIRYIRRTMEFRVRTVLRAEIRRAGRRAELESSGLERVPDDRRRTISIVAAREIGERIARALDGLAEPVRSIVYLRGIEQVPNHAVAERLGIAANTVSKTYQRTLRSLQRDWPDSVFADLADEAAPT